MNLNVALCDDDTQSTYFTFHSYFVQVVRTNVFLVQSCGSLLKYSRDLRDSGSVLTVQIYNFFG